jgi:hypothetical protein
MDLSPIQRRTLDALTRAPSTVWPDGYVSDLRAPLEARVEALAPPDGLYVAKGRLNEHARCEGAFAAALDGELGEFEYGFKAAVGAFVHRAVEADIASERGGDARTLVDHAVVRQLEDSKLLEHWSGLEQLERDEIVAEATRQAAMVREVFPPFERSWQPISEQTLKVRLMGGRVVLSGRPDLVLGRPPAIAIDIKTGDPRPEHAEDGRFYALLMTLMFERPASLAATAYVDSLELQREEVEPTMLERAVDRVVEAVAFASDSARRANPRLTPGPFCRWCPRSETCPASLAREEAPGSAYVGV